MSNAVNTPALQLETRRLEESLRGNTEGRPQILEYNPAEGNISLAPRNGGNTDFGVLCPGAMTRDFGGYAPGRGSSDTRTLERALRDNTNGIPQVFEYNTENGNMALVPANATGRTGPAFGNVCREAMTRWFGGGRATCGLDVWRNFEQNTRRLEDTLSEDAGGPPQVIEYNAADGNMSLAPHSGDNASGDDFGVVCRGAMTGHFGGWGASEERSDTRTLERALRDNTNGTPQVFEYNTENGNMSLVPTNATGRTGPVFGNVCREAMTREFGCGDGKSVDSVPGGGGLSTKIGEPPPDAHGTRVAVLAGDDLEHAGSKTMDGIAYSLEGEGVVRILRGRSDPYAKGKADAALFVWDDGTVPSQQGVRYIVRMTAGDKVTVSENVCGKVCQIPEVMIVPRMADQYRLGSGLLESPILKDRHVLLIGCGSMGGDLAMHLAMAGVGHISLADPDRVEASNLSRLRDAVLADVGRLKVDMLAERILGKNPHCAIRTVPHDITKDSGTLSGFLAETDLVVVSTDNRASRVLVAQGLQAAGKPCIYTRCSTRAESGDCFIARPGEACYECLYGMMGGGNDEIDDWASSKKAGRLAAYCTPEEMDDFKILPGISTDISAITSFAARLAIWELAKGTDGNPFLELCEEFSRFNYFLYVNRREKYFRNEAWAPFDKSGQRPCPQRWYGAAIARREDCACCGNRSGAIDTGDDDAHLYTDITAKEGQNGN